MASPSISESPDIEWQSYVGKAIVRFGDIELISIKCLAHIHPDKNVNSAARLKFIPRTNLLKELLQSRPALNLNLKGLLEGFVRAQELAKTRNLIAHNPVMLDLYINRDTSDILAEHSITSARSGLQTLNLEGLKEFADEVEDLAATLWGHFLRAAESSDPLWRVHDGR